MGSSRALAHIAGVVATLGLAVVVAITAATREGPPALPSATPTASSTPSASASPVSLEGQGPYVVYALDGEVFAFDVAANQPATSLGIATGSFPGRLSRQPSAGGVIAFASTDGSVWTVSRAGLTGVGTIGPDNGREVGGSAVSPNGRRLAIGLDGPAPALVLYDLADGTAKVIARSQRSGDYPENELVPVGWSLGGTVVYQVPTCECDALDPGLYAFDISSERSSVVGGTSDLVLTGFAMSPEGQAIVYADATTRRCAAQQEGPCTGPPFTLKRLAAGQRRTSVLERRSDTRYGEVVWSPDGRTLAVALATDAGPAGLELLDASTGGPIPDAAGGIQNDAVPLALLPGDVLVAGTDAAGRPGQAGPVRSIIALVRGRAVTVATAASPGGPGPIYLGWLR